LWYLLGGREGRFMERSNITRSFTLIELCVTMGILVFALSALVGGLVGFMSLSRISRDKSVAINHARQVLEQVRDINFSEVKNTDWTKWATENGCNSLDNEQVRVTLTSIASDLLEVKVDVDWQIRNRPFSISLTTLKTVY
jgi:type II secretory pathway pseudopilin PulG